MDWQRVVVGIPTFRRPQLLRALISGLAEELRPTETLILIADNDCDEAIARLVGELAEELGLRLEYLPVPERGISQARNALIRGATQVRPNWHWLAMYDDDGVPTPGCVGTLVATAERLQADAAGGRVQFGFPDGVGRIPRQVLDPPDAAQTGPVRMLTGGQNRLLARDLVDGLEDPWFPLDHGLSGGEDYEFFLKAKTVGANLVWVEEAVVCEPVPASRCSTWGGLRRAFLENTANVTTEQKLLGHAAARSHTLQAFVRTFRSLVVGGLRRDSGRLSDAAIELACGLGRLAAHLGVHPQPYR